MKKVGQIIEDARIKKSLSYKDLEEITKIKSGFISAIESGNWQKLPPFPTVLGFVKSLSGALSLDEKTTVAVLKRDYPPGKLDINPKPDISKKPLWNPKTTFLLGMAFVAILILGYLGIQYINFVSPPKIRVESPIEGQKVSGNSVLVFGTTEADAKITVNNQPVLVDSDGKFSVDIEVTKDTAEVIIMAESRSGKTSKVTRGIQTE